MAFNSHFLVVKLTILLASIFGCAADHLAENYIIYTRWDGGMFGHPLRSFAYI